MTERGATILSPAKAGAVANVQKTIATALFHGKIDGSYGQNHITTQKGIKKGIANRRVVEKPSSPFVYSVIKGG